MIVAGLEGAAACVACCCAIAKEHEKITRRPKLIFLMSKILHFDVA
jgi:hypothetical protein